MILWNLFILSLDGVILYWETHLIYKIVRNVYFTFETHKLLNLKKNMNTTSWSCILIKKFLRAYFSCDFCRLIIAYNIIWCNRCLYNLNSNYLVFFSIIIDHGAAAITLTNWSKIASAVSTYRSGVDCMLQLSNDTRACRTAAYIQYFLRYWCSTHGL